jgi:hypothetical protein
MFDPNPRKSQKVIMYTNQPNFDMKHFWKLFFTKTLNFDFTDESIEISGWQKKELKRSIQKNIMNTSSDFFEYIINENLRNMYGNLLNLYNRLMVN